MQQYIEPLITCDKILALFTEQNPAGYTHSDIINLLGFKPTRDPKAAVILPALEKLKVDGHLLTYGMDNHVFKLGGDALIFKANDSYKGLIERENAKEDLQSTLTDLNIKTSANVVSTGNSVQRLNTLLRPATIAQIVIASATIFVAVFAAIISWFSYQQSKPNEDEEKRLRLLESSLQMLQQQIKQIQQQPVKDTVYMITIPPKK